MRLVKWLTGTVVLVALLLLLVPFSAKWYLVHCLERKGYQVHIQRLGVSLLSGEIAVRGLNLHGPGGARLTLLGGDLNLRLLSLLQGRLVFDRVILDSLEADLDWRGDALFIAGVPASAWRSDSDSAVHWRALQLKHAELCHSTSGRCLRLETLNLQDGEWLNEGAEWSFGHGHVTLQKAFLRDNAREPAVFYGGELTLAQGHYGSSSLALSNLRLNNFHYIDRRPVGSDPADAFQTQLGDLHLAALSWQKSEPSQWVVDRLSITSLRQSLFRAADGRVAAPAAWHRLWQWRPDRLLLTSLSLSDGSLVWRDASVVPVAGVNLSQLGVQLGRIDSAQPQSPTEVRVGGRLEDKGLVRLDGQIFPYLGRSQFALNGGLQGLDLSRLIGYTPQWFRQPIDRGGVDVSFDVGAVAGQVQGQSRWQLTEWRPRPPERGREDGALAQALNRMQGNRSIILDLPLQGDADGDVLSFSHLLRERLPRALIERARHGGSSHPDLAILPARPAPSAAQSLVRPLLYPVNGVVPGALDQASLRQVIDELRDDPRRHRVVCPVSTAGEWAALFNLGHRPPADQAVTDDQRAHLLSLARQRGQALRAQLLAAGVASAQITVCEPVLDMTQPGLSFATLTQ